LGRTACIAGARHKCLPKLTSLVTFLFSDKKVTPPAGTGTIELQKERIATPVCELAWE